MAIPNIPKMTIPNGINFTKNVYLTIPNIIFDDPHDFCLTSKLENLKRETKKLKRETRQQTMTIFRDDEEYL